QSDHHFTLRSLLAWTLAAAALLAVMRHSMPETAPGLQTVLDALPYIGLGGLMLTVAGLPIVALAGILLATGRRPKLRAVLVALVAAGLAGGIPLCLCLMEESDDWPYFAGIEAGTILNGLASLLVIWACGYRFKQRAKWNLNAALTAQLAPAPAVRVPLSPRRLAVALATLLLMAAVVAYAAPKRAEEWRQAAIAAEWIKRGFHVGFNDDGALDSVYYRDGSAITDEILKQISAEQSLTMLDLARARIDDRQLALLAPLTNLAHLHLSNCDISDDGLAIVARFGHLQHLVLDNTQVTDAGLAPLLNLPFLQSLSLSVTEVTDDGLDILSRLPQLDHLDVSLTAVTTSAAQRFYQAHPSVRIQAGSTDQHLEYWLSTRGVIAEEVISTDYETLMVFSEAVHLKTAPIKRLHLRGGKTPNGAVFSVTDASLPILADRPELEELDLRDAAITDWGLHELAKLQALKRLDLRGTAVSDRAIARLVKSLPDCEILAPR
ncbi:MAG TPA: hypothetical protein VFI31_24180, partial [Pirellulales bacterium]|nr:hypothetical protein [Pirellulales bacterium]